INEAIEVVKTFGSDDAPKFVNGVLDRLKSNAKKNSA
ncbi:MAG: N utilization substance protein B, partial [Candidatus Hydrogenedentes bacterium]|nr:N utilization substance protein B [Candidatus Hydrogenedentota bacterium]